MTSHPVRNQLPNEPDRQPQTGEVAQQPQAGVVINYQHLCQRVIETTPTVIYVYDLQTHQTVFVSPSAIAVLGYTNAEFAALGTNLLQTLMHPDDQVAVKAHFQRLQSASDLTALEFEYRMQHKSGAWRWFLTHDTIFQRTPEGTPQQVLGVAVNITDRKAAERQLAFDASLLDYAYDSVVATDTDLNITAWNRGAEAMYGWSAVEVMGRKARDVMQSTMSPDERAKALRQLATTDRCCVEVTTHHRDGTPILVEGYTVAIRDAQGQLNGYMSINRDIGERKAMEEALRASEAQLNAILYNIPAAVYMLTTDHRYLMVNRVYEQENQITNAAIHGRSVHDRWPAAYADGLIENERQVLATKTSMLVEEEVERDGEIYHYATIKAPLLDEAGEPYAIIGISTNITERKRAEAALRESEERLRQFNEQLEQRVRERTAQLEQRNRELDQFAYIASHDLKTPLRGIQHLAHWIVDDAASILPAKSLGHLAKLGERAKRMERLLDDVRAYLRVGRREVEPQLVNCHVLLNDILALLAPPAGYTVHLGDDLPMLITLKTPLEIILRNLIDNAIKHHHAPAQGEVWITAQPLAGGWEFCVRDNGPGIDPQYHERIFGVFKTLQPRDRVEGSGMGLALVKKTVAYCGGTVRVEAAVGQGAAFYFTWPNVVAERADGAPAGKASHR